MWTRTLPYLLYLDLSLYVPKYIPLTIECTPLSKTKSITPCHVSSVSFCPLATGEMRCCCFSFPLIVSKVLWFCVHSLYPICKHMLVAAAVGLCWAPKEEEIILYYSYIGDDILLYAGAEHIEHWWSCGLQQIFDTLCQESRNGVKVFYGPVVVGGVFVQKISTTRAT